MSTPAPEKRTRVYMACLNCRRRKVKCLTDNSGNPCQHCIRRGILCTYLSIRDEQEHSSSAHIYGASGHNELISQPVSPAPQTPGPYFAEIYGLLQAGHFAHFERPQLPPIMSHPIVRVPESGTDTTPYPGGHPGAVPTYYPYFGPLQGETDPPQQISAPAGSSQWLSASHQPHAFKEGGAMAMGVIAEDFSAVDA
ncbi:hypothetical protein K438DRAFT_1970300 [Mycena galopus ATCC 62051]|nr:hypothetical protein K438DRAFT_1970300 [Mycena galopus ATCC 62051]